MLSVYDGIIAAKRVIERQRRVSVADPTEAGSSHILDLRGTIDDTHLRAFKTSQALK